jgi:hypothetical protein
MPSTVPTPVAAALGIVPTILDGVRRLPGKAISLPVYALSSTLTTLDRTRREYDALAERGERLIARLRGTSFDEVEDRVEDALQGTPLAKPYDALEDALEDAAENVTALVRNAPATARKAPAKARSAAGRASATTGRALDRAADTVEDLATDASGTVGSAASSVADGVESAAGTAASTVTSAAEAAASGARSAADTVEQATDTAADAVATAADTTARTADTAADAVGAAADTAADTTARTADTAADAAGAAADTAADATARTADTAADAAGAAADTAGDRDPEAPKGAPTPKATEPDSTRVNTAASSDVVETVERVSSAVGGAVLDHDDLPLPDYDHLTLGSLRGRMRALDVPQLVQVRDYEKAHANRLPIVTMLDNRIAKLATDPTAPLSGSTPTKDVPAKPRAGKRGSKVDPATTGPKINPPSQGDPTNPAQPR